MAGFMSPRLSSPMHPTQGVGAGVVVVVVVGVALLVDVGGAEEGEVPVGIEILLDRQSRSRRGRTSLTLVLSR